MPIENNGPKGENSPNLVTLLLSQKVFGSKVSYFDWPEFIEPVRKGVYLFLELYLPNHGCQCRSKVQLIDQLSIALIGLSINPCEAVDQIVVGSCRSPWPNCRSNRVELSINPCDDVEQSE
jgi:hypothetical protein